MFSPLYLTVFSHWHLFSRIQLSLSHHSPLLLCADPASTCITPSPAFPTASAYQPDHHAHHSSRNPSRRPLGLTSIPSRASSRYTLPLHSWAIEAKARPLPLVDSAQLVAAISLAAGTQRHSPSHHSDVLQRVTAHHQLQSRDPTNLLWTMHSSQFTGSPCYSGRLGAKRAHKNRYVVGLQMYLCEFS